MIPISKPSLGAEEKKAVMGVLESGMLASGEQTARLEEKFANVCGTSYAIATSSGTTALQTALLACGVGKGDEVITTPFTFIATLNSIIFTGAKPVLVDIEEDTFNICPDLIKKAISPRTKAILPVHLFGHPCEMDAIMEMADQFGLIVIEDSAQAVGAEYQGQRVGSFGIGCFSLYATKNVTSGEGGMITTSDPVMAEQCRLIRSHGMKERYCYKRLGYNFRLSDIHAAIGMVQLDRLETFNKKRQSQAKYFNQHIVCAGVTTPTVRADCQSVWHQYTLRIGDGRSGSLARDAAAKSLRKAGVGTGIFYPVPAYKHNYLRAFGVPEVSLPVVEKLANEVLSLPVHPQLSPADLKVITKEVNKLAC